MIREAGPLIQTTSYLGLLQQTTTHWAAWNRNRSSYGSGNWKSQIGVPAPCFLALLALPSSAYGGITPSLPLSRAPTLPCVSEPSQGALLTLRVRLCVSSFHEGSGHIVLSARLATVGPHLNLQRNHTQRSSSLIKAKTSFRSEVTFIDTGG